MFLITAELGDLVPMLGNKLLQRKTLGFTILDEYVVC